ncbi:hypothetical protein EDB85DRAFT_2021856 [Lactarius pseudohatsudake]|nr:hypothetical protein EDB85DRAFT_2021856 [Lactarius pseudohatsudake]
MPRNRKKKSAIPQSPVHPLCREPPVPVPVISIGLSSAARLAVDRSNSSATAVHPSAYRDGFVDPSGDILTNITCQTEYSHLSPEELRFKDLEIDTGLAPWDLHSFEETRLRYYLDEGRTSVPQFGPPTPAFTFSEPGRPAPGPIVDGKSATIICSMCAARLDADAQGCEEYEATSEGLGRDTPTPSLSRYYDTRGQKKRSRISRRVRRLEKTVESLSQGLILALTELNDFRGRSTTTDDPKTNDSGVVDVLTTAFSSLSTVVDHPNGIGASEPDAILRPSEQWDPTIQHENATQHTNTDRKAPFMSRVSKFGPTTWPNDVVDRIMTGNDSSIFASGDRSPISGLLGPILDFMTCPEVFRFLKLAEAHAILRSSQLYDLFWVSDNLFNVHGGILIYCLQKSLIAMDAISGHGSSAWSQDSELMQKLDETYRKQLRPHIDTDGSRNNVTKIAWEMYCLELGGIFSEQFPDWESAISFFQNLSEEYDGGFLNPIITWSYIEDLTALWTQVHPALLEVTRWLEPFIDYGPDYHRATPLYDATIALGRHARELFLRRGGVKESPGTSLMRDKNLMRLLREHRSGELKKMQREMRSVISGAVSRNFDPTSATADETSSAEVVALVDRAKQLTSWRVAEPHSAQLQDALALREVRVMTSYRPLLLRAGTAAARIRSDMFRVLAQTGLRTEGGPIGEREIFWDGIVLPSSL